MADDVVEHPGRSEQQAPGERERAAARAGAPARALIAHDQLRGRNSESRCLALDRRLELGLRRAPVPALECLRRRGRGRVPSARARRRSSRCSRAGAGTRRSGTASPPCHATPGRASPSTAGCWRASARSSHGESVSSASSISASPVRCRDDQLRTGAGHEDEPKPARARRPPQPHADRPAAQQHRALALHSRQTMRRAGRADHRAPGLPRRGPVLARGLGRGRLGRHAGRPHPRDLARAAARRA